MGLFAFIACMLSVAVPNVVKLLRQPGGLSACNPTQKLAVFSTVLFLPILFAAGLDRWGFKSTAMFIFEIFGFLALMVYGRFLIQIRKKRLGKLVGGETN